MSAFLVCMVQVDDPDTYKEYTAETPAIIKAHGGKFLVRGGDVEAIEGEPFNDRLVVVEFPSKEAARTFYKSDDYQRVIGFRHSSSKAQFLLADGVATGTDAPNDKVVISGA